MNKKEHPQTDKIICKKYLELTSYFRVKSKTFLRLETSKDVCSVFYWWSQTVR